MTLTHPFVYDGLIRVGEERWDWEQELERGKSQFVAMFKRHGLTVTRIGVEYTGASPDDGERTTLIQGEARGPQTGTKAEENRTRRWAQRLGLLIRKSRARHIRLHDLGGYALVNEHGYSVLVCGDRFACSLADIQTFLATYEHGVRDKIG